MIIHSQDIHSVTCPFCHNQNKLHLEDMRLYFEEDGFFVRSNYTDDDNKLISMLEMAFEEHKRPDGPFKKHWDAELNKSEKSRNGSQKTTRANTVEGGLGIMLRPEVFIKYGTRTGKNRYTIGKYTLTYDPAHPLDTVIHLISSGSTHLKALCCPYCECFFPTSFFDLDCYFIILAGESSVGKTMWLTALFRNGFAPLTGSVNEANGWKLEADFSAAFDGPSRNFKNGVRFYGSKGIIPDETPNAIPPIFLTLTWSHTKKDRKSHRKITEKYTHNVCMIDTMGESWGTNTSDGSPKSIKFSGLADATIYIIQPYQGAGCRETDDSAGFMISDDFWDTQDDLMVCAGTDSHQNDSGKTDKRKGSRKYNDLYLRHFCNNSEIKRKPCAFVISQIDIYNTEPFRENTASIRYFDSVFSDCDMTGKTDMISKRKVLLDQEKLALHNIAAYHIIRSNFPGLSGSANTFKNCNYFAISSFSGDKKEKGLFNMNTEWFKPLSRMSRAEMEKIGSANLMEVDFIEEYQRNQAVNIHEPMIWTLLRLMGDKLAETTAAAAPERAAGDPSRRPKAKNDEYEADEDVFVPDDWRNTVRSREKRVLPDETVRFSDDSSFDASDNAPSDDWYLPIDDDWEMTNSSNSQNASAADSAPSKAEGRIRRGLSLIKSGSEPDDDNRTRISLGELINDDESNSTMTIFKSFGDKS